jgi:heparan-alpha-glucosaminide N-acetyltransferase
MKEKYMPEMNTDKAADRIGSIDVLRGLTILVMIFVNDVAGVHGTPAWMKHIAPPLSDGMTFVDIVFPAFLFIVGMSIPFAIEKRFRTGLNLKDVWKHIVLRTIGLLVIGVFMVNSDSASGNGLLSPAVWVLLMYSGVILVWNRTEKYRIFMQISGVLILVAASFLFRGQGPQELIELRTKWWGILGLIGWSYLVGCTVYLVFRPKLYPVIGMIGLLYTVYIADQAGFFKGFYTVFPWINIGAALGSHGAVVVSGTALGMILQRDSGDRTHRWRVQWALLFGLAMAVGAILLHSGHEIHQMFIINKILATPPWCLWSSAIVTWIWIIVYWLIDISGFETWTIIIRPAGANALFAYILAPVLYAVFELIALLFNGFNFYYWLGHDFAIGFFRSLVFAFGVTWLAGGLRRVGVVLKL